MVEKGIALKKKPRVIIRVERTNPEVLKRMDRDQAWPAMFMKELMSKNQANISVRA